MFVLTGRRCWWNCRCASRSTSSSETDSSDLLQRPAWLYQLQQGV